MVLGTFDTDRNMLGGLPVGMQIIVLGGGRLFAHYNAIAFLLFVNVSWYFSKYFVVLKKCANTITIRIEQNVENKRTRYGQRIIKVG